MRQRALALLHPLTKQWDGLRVVFDVIVGFALLILFFCCAHCDFLFNCSLLCFLVLCLVSQSSGFGRSRFSTFSE